MPGRFRVTYDVVDDVSAADGCTSEAGYAYPAGWRVPLEVEPFPVETLSLREALKAAGDRSYSARYGAGFEDGGRAFYTVDSDPNYRTGEQTTYAIHPPEGITAASYGRLARVLTGGRRG
jgi:hypothetical protein